MGIVDLTDIDLYPRRYKYHNGNVEIQSLIIENVERQKDKLIAKQSYLNLGESIRVFFKFGHNIGKPNEKECWEDIIISGIYIVTRIVPHEWHNQIELVVKEKK